MKAYWGCGGTTPLILNFGTRGRCDISALTTFAVNKHFNLLKQNDIYICRTTALTSRRYISNIYSTNTHTEYFKHAA